MITPEILSFFRRRQDELAGQRFRKARRSMAGLTQPGGLKPLYQKICSKQHAYARQINPGLPRPPISGSNAEARHGHDFYTTCSYRAGVEPDLLAGAVSHSYQSTPPSFGGFRSVGIRSSNFLSNRSPGLSPSDLSPSAMGGIRRNGLLSISLRALVLACGGRPGFAASAKARDMRSLIRDIPCLQPF